MVRRAWGLVCAAALIGCGDDLGARSGPRIDAGGAAAADSGVPDRSPDGGPLGSCQLAGCNNGIDDDADGLIDGWDPECTGHLDNDEGSFSMGIPDQMTGRWQDCFLDGNTSGGDDGCRLHICCQVGASGGEDCPVDQSFDPARDCPEQTDSCVAYCRPLTPIGCDCFGCCTVCEPGGGECLEILINPDFSPDCTAAAASDPSRCAPCSKSADCAAPPCDPEGCVLCRGQSPADRPSGCEDQDGCPAGDTCEGGPECEDCSPDGYCATGCCLSVVQ